MTWRRVVDVIVSGGVVKRILECGHAQKRRLVDLSAPLQTQPTKMLGSAVPCPECDAPRPEAA